MARKAIVHKAARKMRLFMEAKKAGRHPKLGTRVYNRCKICGRRHGFLRKFEMCRICIREKYHQGELVGIRKSSW